MISGDADELAVRLETHCTWSDRWLAFADHADRDEHIVFPRFACPESGFTIDEIEPRLFSLTIRLGPVQHVTDWG